MRHSLALVVTYNPDPDFSDHLKQLFMEFEKIVVVDNGSSLATQKMLQDQTHSWNGALTLLPNPKNLGIATALNQGFAWAIQHGYNLLVTLDQDSSPVPGMNEALRIGFERHPNKDKLAVLAPVIVEELLKQPARYLRLKNRFFFERVTCEQSYLRNVSSAITSGSLYNLRTLSRDWSFPRRFFYRRSRHRVLPKSSHQRI